MNLCVLDISATNKRIALVSNNKILIKEKIGKKIADEINNFLKKCKNKGFVVDNCLIAIAGEVKNQIGKTTNSDIKISKKQLLKKTPLKNVFLINDFQAISYGINKTKKITIQKGKPSTDQYCVIGPGTGCGMSFFNKNSIASEGGHAKITIDLGFNNLSFKEVEVEDVLSGKGITNIYKKIKNTKIDKKDKKDFPENILELAKKDEKAKLTLKIFFDILAKQCQTIALYGLSKKGVYVSGGIITKIYKHCDKKRFRKIFNNHKKMNKTLKDIPIYFILDYDVTFYGGYNYFLKHAKN